MKKTNTGFTLIEVLIAAIILFSAIGLIAQLYSSSTVFATKASERAQFYQYSGIAISVIKNKLRNQIKQNFSLKNLYGTEVVGGIEYNWFANRTAFLSPPPGYDDGIADPPRFGVFEVIVTTPRSNAKEFEFTFEAVTWP